MEAYQPKVVCFSCSFGWGYLRDEKVIAAGTANWIPVVCSGKIGTDHILKAFRAGADGVLILGCPEGRCHFQEGNFQTRKKVYLIQKVLDEFGIEPERLEMHLSTDAEGGKIAQMIDRMKAKLARLGPVTRI